MKKMPVLYLIYSHIYHTHQIVNNLLGRFHSILSWKNSLLRIFFLSWTMNNRWINRTRMKSLFLGIWFATTTKQGNHDNEYCRHNSSIHIPINSTRKLNTKQFIKKMRFDFFSSTFEVKVEHFYWPRYVLYNKKSRP